MTRKIFQVFKKKTINTSNVTTPAFIVFDSVVRLGMFVRMCLSNRMVYSHINQILKNRNGNAISGDIFVPIYEQIKRYEVTDTHYERIQRNYLVVRLNCVKMNYYFVSDHPDFEGKVN